MTERPLNFLHIISDQHLAECAGYEGHPQALTPHFDRLAETGVRFRHAYTQNPICTPSRVSILSGQYCHQHGYYGLSGPTPANLPSFLSHLREHGYRTAAIGKLHLPNDPVDWVLTHCDYWADAYGAPSRHFGGNPSEPPSAYFAYLRAKGLSHLEDSMSLDDSGINHNEARPSELTFADSVEGWALKEARHFIDTGIGGADKPWCVQVSLPRPHQCYTPDQRFWDLYSEDLDLPRTYHSDLSHRPPHFRSFAEQNRVKQFGTVFEPSDPISAARRIWRGYLACISQVDHAVGLLVEFLAESGQLDRTVIVYHADHGAYTGHFGLPEKAPGICSEKVCRVPMLWHVPGIAQAGSEVTELVENIDVAATFVSLAGVPAMPTQHGQDLTPLLRGERTTLRDIAVTEHPLSKSVRWGPWRLVHYQPEMFPDEPDVGELYHIERDPDETQNLYHTAEHKSIVDTGRRLLLEWLIRTSLVRTVHPPIKGSSGAGLDGTGPAETPAGKRVEPLLRHGQVNYL